MPGSLTINNLSPSKKFSNKKIGIVVADWNPEITDALLEGARAALLEAGVRKRHIEITRVPGSFELPLGAQRLAEHKSIDGVIALGCVIQGDTPHFDYICQAAAQGLMKVSLVSGKPVAFGVLTTNNHKQAMERAGGKLGNKGEEAAVTVLNMLI